MKVVSSWLALAKIVVNNRPCLIYYYHDATIDSIGAENALQVRYSCTNTFYMGNHTNTPFTTIANIGNPEYNIVPIRAITTMP